MRTVATSWWPIAGGWRWLYVGLIPIVVAAVTPRALALSPKIPNQSSVKDPYHAKRYYRQAMNADTLQARKLGFKNLLMAAYTKNPTGMYYLGRYYLLNCGKPISSPAAYKRHLRYGVQWLTSAGRARSIDADLLLGSAVFFYGFGAKVNRPLACHWMRAAERIGSARARYAMGFRHMYKGMGAGVDWELAAKRLRQAAKMGCGWAALKILPIDARFRNAVWHSLQKRVPLPLLNRFGNVGKFLNLAATVDYNPGSRQRRELDSLLVWLHRNGRMPRFWDACGSAFLPNSIRHRIFKLLETVRLSHRGTACARLMVGLAFDPFTGDGITEPNTHKSVTLLNYAASMAAASHHGRAQSVYMEAEAYIKFTEPPPPGQLPTPLPPRYSVPARFP